MRMVESGEPLRLVLIDAASNATCPCAAIATVATTRMAEIHKCRHMGEVYVGRERVVPQVSPSRGNLILVMEYTIRRAIAGDAAVIARHRVEMFRAMGVSDERLTGVEKASRARLQQELASGV